MLCVFPASFRIRVEMVGHGRSRVTANHCNFSCKDKVIGAQDPQDFLKE